MILSFSRDVLTCSSAGLSLGTCELTGVLTTFHQKGTQRLRALTATKHLTKQLKDGRVCFAVVRK